MKTYKHSLWSTPTVLIVAVMVAIGAGVPTITAHAAGKAKVDKEVKVRKEEEQRLKKQDKLYSKHAKALADQYAETAKIVARNGGDPKPLQDATAYFDKESK